MANIQRSFMNPTDQVDGIQNRRSSSTSAKSAASSVETTITKLLMSTKQLLQTLTQWSRRSVNEKIVSNAYVQLGNDFKVVSKVFAHCGIDVSDLGDVPMDLRKVLEAALREKPSDDNLNKYLPTIREIIVTLLDKLKVKQALLKTIKQEQSIRKTQHHQRPSVVSSLSLPAVSSPKEPPDTAPIQSPYESNTTPSSGILADTPRSPPMNLSIPQPIQQRTLSEDEALSQLKKSSNLQRRASKRFSAYHMAKLTNHSTTEAAAAAALASGSTSSSSNPLPLMPALDVDNDEGPLVEATDPSIIPHEDQQHISSEAKDLSENYTLFLKLNGRTKKCSVPSPLNMNVLRLLFVEKFAYSPGGNTFPDIYLKDPEYSVFYEVDEQSVENVKNGSIIELQSNSMRQDFSEIVTALKDEIAVSQQEILTHINNINISNKTSSPAFLKDIECKSGLKLKDKTIDVVEIKKEISKLKQLHIKNKQDVQATISSVKERLSEFKMVTINSSASPRKSYIEKSQNQLSEVSDDLLSRVDDLQDLIEILRKDVAIRGARPSKRKLESVHKELICAQNDLEKMKNYIGQEKPHWKTIWEKELEKVCEEQQFLTLQEDLAVDLNEDLGKALETFDLVELCCAEQEKNPNKSRINPILPIPKPGELRFARERLLMDVQALHPDHDGRIEALEKAEKIWEKEREYKDGDEFKDELGTFVENSSFKRSGGVEEVERLRRQKDEENLRANFQPPTF